MATEEINALRRLMENVNRATTNNTASIGKLNTEQLVLKQKFDSMKLVAERALQMCDDLSARVTQLESESKSRWPNAG